MKNRITTIILFMLLAPLSIFSQKAFQDGEWLKFRVYYGIFNASYATLEVSDANLNDKDVFHVIGRGKSTGLLHLFFKVDDNYETYIDKDNGLPYRFIRQIDEGGHTKDLQIDFNQELNKAYVFNRKHDENKIFTTQENVHDMLSSFYYIRNSLNDNILVCGQEFHMNMFFDNENHNFKLKFLGREVLNTKFGKIATLKFRPYVMILINSFDVMIKGMEREQFLKFRMALLPASGFQSAQFRMIELNSTPLEHLVPFELRKNFSSENSIEELYENLYWKKGGIDLATGEKTLTLKQFELRYTPRFLRIANQVKGETLYHQYLKLPEKDKNDQILIDALRTFDTNLNVNWLLMHMGCLLY